MALKVVRNEIDGWDVLREDEGVAPKLDGDAVTERLRAAPGLERTVIVLLTASVQEAAIERGYEAGADAYIKKPFSPAELAERIASALARR